MKRLEEHFITMTIEMPFVISEELKPYILELATIYACEVAQASLEKAAENAVIEPKGMMTRVDKESITNPKNITLL